MKNSLKLKCSATSEGQCECDGGRINENEKNIRNGGGRESGEGYTSPGPF